MKYLNSIDSPEDLKKLSIKKLPQVCDDIRKFLIETVSKTGGHLASNLGSVEITVALHYVFNSPEDKFCWDVGHQSYVHKILTGRKDELKTVRQYKGLSGFPKINESKHDHYNVGHAGTSISQALAEATATYVKNIKQEKILLEDKNQSNNKKPSAKIKNNLPLSIAIIGDGSIGAGMAFEALNHGGHLKVPFLVLLNDNEMSISKNVGALGYTLSRLLSRKRYRKTRKLITKMIRFIPFFGPIMIRMIRRFGGSIKSIMIDNQFFQELGFRYLGPLDGHDVIGLVKMFQDLRSIEKPTLLHLVSKKGKGYHHAEANPISYHGVSSFDKEEGVQPKNNNSYSLSDFVGATLSKLGEANSKIIVITPAMTTGSGLTEFEKNFPERFFDVGIAEQHATTFAGGLAKAGLTPFLCIYSSFLQRGYDQLIHDIALMNLPVRIVIDRAGCVGNDGETHQGLYDIAFMSTVPNMKILSADNHIDLIYMLKFMETYNEAPISVRFPKKSYAKDFFLEWKKNPILPKNYSPFKSKIISKGKDCVIFTEGCMLDIALDVQQRLEKSHISLEVISLKSIKPLDLTTIKKSIKNKKLAFVLENHSIKGGAGERIISELKEFAHKFHLFAYPDEIILHGSIKEIEKHHKLDANSIASKIKRLYKKVTNIR